MNRPFPISISVTEPVLTLLDRMAYKRRLSRSELIRRLVLAESKAAGETTDAGDGKPPQEVRG